MTKNLHRFLSFKGKISSMEERTGVGFGGSLITKDKSKGYLILNEERVA